MSAPEKRKKIFSGPCDFMLGVADLVQLPNVNVAEIAFAGRSNVGKSSLINAVMGRSIAHVSKTPGRTQQLNFFNVGDHFCLVDMPGYGYAKVSKTLRDQWDQLIGDYLRGRANLKIVFVLIDARHGFKDTDLDLLNMLNEAAVATRILLTKSDDVKKPELDRIKAEVEHRLKKSPASFPLALPVSSWERSGIEELQDIILGLI
jgi:GTP-binding protein